MDLQRGSVKIETLKLLNNCAKKSENLVNYVQNLENFSHKNGFFEPEKILKIGFIF